MYVLHYMYFELLSSVFVNVQVTVFLGQKIFNLQHQVSYIFA